VIFHPMVEPIALALVVVVALALVATRVVRAPSWRGTLAWCGRALMVLLVAAVLLRPGVPAPDQTVNTAQADVFFLVDTTASSAAEDWAGTSPRLDGIRADVTELVKQFAGANFELITFSRSAVISVPLTSDAASVITGVNVLRTEVSGYAQGSSIGLAADLLHDQLRMAADARPQRARAVFYFGDGEQTAATTPESFRASAAYVGGGAVFGYGSATGAPMLANDGQDADEPQYVIDPRSGEPALSRLDTDSLSVIAEDLGLRFEVRNPAVVVDPGEVSISSRTDDGEIRRAGVTELYWMPALGLFALLSVELGLVFAALQGSRRGRSRS
jgi:Ca-activated chloride channel family protein